MPNSPYLVSGTVYSSNGLNLSGAIVTVTADGNSLRAITNSIGQYVMDLANIGYTFDTTATYSGTDIFGNEYFTGSFLVEGQNKQLNITLSARTVNVFPAGNREFQVVNIGGKGVSRDNPFPIIDSGLPDDHESEWFISKTDGQPDEERVTKNGITYKRTFTYTTVGGMDILTKRTKWLRL